MLALTPENDYNSVEIVVFGGQKNGFECPHVLAIATTSLGGRTSYRMTISWEEAGAKGVLLIKLPGPLWLCRRTPSWRTMCCHL
jgi:hypothetical protein